MSDCQGCICEKCEHNNGATCEIDVGTIFEYTCKNCHEEQTLCTEFKERP